MAESKEELVRTTITLPKSLKKKMSASKINWSEFIREVVAIRVEDVKPNMVEAVILNEKIRRPAPKGWSSAKVIKEWRKKR